MFIYLISHPESNHVYVGKTKKTLKQRLAEHISKSKTGKYKMPCWIRSLSSKPKISLLEECDDSRWKWRERYWIKFARQVCVNDCLNQLDGGDEGFTGRHSEKTKQQMSKNAMGHKRNLGRRHTVETIEKLSIINKSIDFGGKFKKGYSPSEETKKKMSKSKVGNKSHLGYNHTEKTKEILRLRKKGKRKLTKEVALEIKRKYVPRKYGLKRLATEYGVSDRTILEIIHDRYF